MKVLHDSIGGAAYHADMFNPGAPTRTLTLVLAESDWRALRAAEPDAVAWLHAQIRERLASPSTEVPRVRYSPPSAATADSWWGNDDEY